MERLPIQIKIPEGEEILKITGGEHHCLFLMKSGKVYGADDVDTFDEDSFKESVEWLNKAANYQAMFKIMKSIEPSN